MFDVLKPTIFSSYVSFHPEKIAHVDHSELLRTVHAGALAEEWVSSFHEAIFVVGITHSEPSLRRRRFGVNHSYSW